MADCAEFDSNLMKLAETYPIDMMNEVLQGADDFKHVLDNFSNNHNIDCFSYVNGDMVREIGYMYSYLALLQKLLCKFNGVDEENLINDIEYHRNDKKNRLKRVYLDN